MDGIIITSYLGDPGDSPIRVDFLSNLTRPDPVEDTSLYWRHIGKYLVDESDVDESRMDKPDLEKRRRDRGRPNELFEKMKTSQPDWLSEEPPRSGPPSADDKKSQENQGQEKKARPDGDRP